MITGKDLIAWGYDPAPWFGQALKTMNTMEGLGRSREEIKAWADEYVPKPIETMPLKSLSDGANGFETYLSYNNEDERANYNAVMKAMTEVMRTPVAEKGVVMPDACPTGPGNIPVGAVVASKHVHPGWHSADICCSVMMTTFKDVDPKEVLNSIHGITHFGGGGRSVGLGNCWQLPDILEKFEANPFLKGLEESAIYQMGTQGDGNHFSFVGRLRSTGDVALVTHHGSRNPGAMLYKRGIQAAMKHTSKIAPDVAKQNAWVDADSNDGKDYWSALQLIRKWTKVNHLSLHDAVRMDLGLLTVDKFWNEHNFVFERDGLFYHAKGATPMWDHHVDCQERRLIPLNMSEPVLVVESTTSMWELNPAGILSMGFAPHGAGRNISRTEHIRRQDGSAEQAMERETEGLDVRWFSGIPDASELPSAYKCAKTMQKEIEAYNLAEVVDYVDPYGCIMAGDWLKPARDKRAKERSSR